MAYTYKEFAMYVKGIIDSVDSKNWTKELNLIKQALDSTIDSDSNDILKGGQLITVPCWDAPDEVPYGEICPCNPKNGGSGICGCTMGNKLVTNPKKYGMNSSNISTNFNTDKNEG